MKSISKKVMSVVLAVVMMLTLGVFAFADSDVVFGTDIIDEDAGTYAITSTDGTEADNGVLTIPAVYVTDFGNREIVEIDTGVFAKDAADYLATVTKVVIENGVKKIGISAFAELPALETVVFEGDVQIEESAFANCTALTKVEFNGGAVIVDKAFEGCTALAEIVTADDAVYECSKDAVKDTLWYDNAVNDGTMKFVVLGNALIDYTGEEETVTIPMGIVTVGANAFNGNDTLKTLIFGKDVKILGDGAFYGCSALKKVKYSVEGEITKVGSDVFTETPYFDNFEGEFFTVGNVLVKYFNVESNVVSVPNTVVAIADNCFMHAVGEDVFDIKSIFIPLSVKEIGEDALYIDIDGETKIQPVIFAFEGSDAMKALTDAGYEITALKYVKGDVDGDGATTPADARFALRLSVALEESTDELVYAADVDGDGKVSSADARILLRIAVGLDNYSLNDLMNIPTTRFEILSKYKDAVNTAAKNRLGYTKTVANAVVNVDANAVSSKKISTVAGKNSVNQTYAYTKDTDAAVDALPGLDLDDTTKIKAARCDLKNGKYYITIVFEDALDTEITLQNPEYKGETPYIASVIPVVSGKVFYDAFAAADWFKVIEEGTFTPTFVRKYALTYTAPTITVVLDAETSMPESIELSVNYHFVLDGRINFIDITSKNFKSGEAKVDRLDTVTYTNFK